MSTMSPQLQLKRCPHCGIAGPYMPHVHFANNTGGFFVHRSPGGETTIWAAYACSSCRALVLAEQTGGELVTYPSRLEVSLEIPDRARTYLEQALDSLHAPDGAVMLAASAIDAMLKAKGLKEGSLNARINDAARDHLITDEMAEWAHDVRLDANDQRHADDATWHATAEDAQLVIDFASTLAEILFVLPARVKRGRKIAPAAPKT